MKTFVQFLIRGGPEGVQDALGSDGVFILDGRNKLDTMKCDAQERMYKLRNVQPHYIGYKIMRGERISRATEIYRWIRSGATTK